MAMESKKIVPIGIDSFDEIVEGNYYYVDKTGFIKDILERGAKVTLITRPRRFGKTLNMLMLKSFFEISKDAKRSFFEKLSIGQDVACMEHQGRYPVIFFTFSSIKVGTQEQFEEKIHELVTREYSRHLYLLESKALTIGERQGLQDILAGVRTSSLYNGALYTLTNMLYKHYGVRPIVLIDEYDTPVLEAYASKNQDYYAYVVGFMRTFLTDGLKTNSAFHKAVLTGVTRIAKESIFSGLNNASVHPVTDTLYGSWFGFTEDEVNALMDYYEASVSMDIVRAWYDGYRMGNHDHIYNPWSITNMLFRQGDIQQYWINTGNNDLVKNVITQRAGELRNDVERLINGHVIRKDIVGHTTFDMLDKHDCAAWNLLLTAGYLSFQHYHDQQADLYIPNEELRRFFKQSIMHWCTQQVNMTDFTEMLTALTEGNLEEFESFFTDFVQQSFSFRDIGGKEPESFYHAFAFGLFASLQAEYQVLSNRESGLGIYDLAIVPKDIRRAGILIEFKRVNPATKKTIDDMAALALQQLEDLAYEQELRARGIKNIIKLGIAFKGKQVVIRHA